MTTQSSRLPSPRVPPGRLYTLLRAMLVPLAKFALRHGLKFQEFSQATKEAFITAAKAELSHRGINESVSRVSAVTGLQRKDLKRLAELPEEKSPKANLIAKLVWKWSVSLSAHSKKKSSPALTYQGKDSEFADLVRSISSDLNHHTVLSELDRLGLTTKHEGRVTLEVPEYVNSTDIEGAYEMLIQDIDSLVASVSENVGAPAHNTKNLHATTFFDNVAVNDQEKVRRGLLKLGEKFHHQVRKFLSRFDKDLNPRKANSQGGVQVHVSTFSVTHAPVTKQGSEEKR